MAIEKEKVITRYKALFGSVGLSQTRLDEISAKLALKMADEATDEDIDARLNEQNDIYPFAEIKKHDDRILNEKNNPNKKPDKVEKVEKKEEEEAVPSWAKSLLEKVEGLENAKKTESITEKFKKDERLKGIPEFAFKGRIPKDEESYEEAVTELATDFKAFAEKAKLSNYGLDTPPNGEGKPAGDVKKMSSEEAKKIVQGMNA